MDLKRYLPFMLILAGMLTAYALGIGEYINFQTLKAYREEITEWVDTNPKLAPLVFISGYWLLTALSIPGAVFVTIFGGFLFPQPYATLYVVCGATLGAVTIFSAAKTAFGDLLRKKAGKKLQKMEKGFQEDAASYLLFLRLVPLFPFWLVNLAPAFFEVPLRTFVWTTFVGIIPGAFVFSQAGSGLGAIFDSGELLSVNGILNNDLKLALIALGGFALLPILVRRLLRTK